MRPPLSFENTRDGEPIASIRAKPVDGLGRERDQLSRLDQFRGLSKALRPNWDNQGGRGLKLWFAIHDVRHNLPV